MPWSVTGAATCAVRAGGDGWPWPYEVTLAADARDTALSSALAADQPGR